MKKRIVLCLLAPSLPPVEELEQAMAVFCCCLKLAALEKSKK